MSSTKDRLSKKEREEFTKQQLEYFFEMSHPKWGRVIKYAFIKGTATGFGVFLGGTLLIGLLIWVFSLIGNVPFLDEIANSAKDTLDKSN